jgi:hypothetical protein
VACRRAHRREAHRPREAPGRPSGPDLAPRRPPGIGLAVAHKLDPLLARCAAHDTPLGNAVEALAVMARAFMRRLGVVGISPLRVIAFTTGGLLLARVPSG